MVNYVFKYLSVSIILQTIFFQPRSPQLSCLNFNTLDIVSRYREPQLQVGENYSYLFNLGPKSFKH